jgi:hypothetical protein
MCEQLCNSKLTRLFETHTHPGGRLVSGPLPPPLSVACCPATSSNDVFGYSLCSAAPHEHADTGAGPDNSETALLPPTHTSPTTPHGAVCTAEGDRFVSPRPHCRRTLRPASAPRPQRRPPLLQPGLHEPALKYDGCRNTAEAPESRQDVPPVVLTSGPGLGLRLPDILAVCRQGRPVRLDPSPEFAALIAAGPEVLRSKLEAGVRTLFS